MPSFTIDQADEQQVRLERTTSDSVYSSTADHQQQKQQQQQQQSVLVSFPTAYRDSKLQQQEPPDEDESSDALDYSSDDESVVCCGLGNGTRFGMKRDMMVNETVHKYGHELLRPQLYHPQQSAATTLYEPNYPSLTSYPDSSHRQALHKLSLQSRQQIHGNDDDNDDDNLCIDKLASLLSAATLLEAPSLTTTSSFIHPQPPVPQKKPNHDISSRYQLEWQTEHEQTRAAIQALIDMKQSTAEQIKSAEAEQLQRQQQEEEDEAAKLQAAKAKRAATAPSQEPPPSTPPPPPSTPQDNKLTAPPARPSPQQKSSPSRDYLSRAKKWMSQLQAVQDSVAPFETNKQLSKRRLQMKKIINGKVNTLSEHVAQIQSVAAQVVDAIGQARKDDAVVKQQLESNNNNTNIAPEAKHGKRYFCNMLSSKVMVRAQAEGFNGIRGDGFPLANCLAAICQSEKDLIPLLSAHMFTVCPVAIPHLPHPETDSSEEELMTGLGMQKRKDGQYETFERFLSRIEGLVSLVANVQASEPSTHMLFGGHEGAVKWLGRFLDLLPDTVSPLPLLTAPVLDAFLTGAGHMLANIHGDKFRTLLTVIENDIVQRLDQTAIGMPSATRLKKTVAGGFDWFRDTLPSRALPELYYGANRSLATTTTSAATTATTQQQQQSPFHPNASTTSQSSPFAPSSSTTVSQPQQSNPFAQTVSQSQSSPFATNAPAESPFLGASTPVQTKDNRPLCKFYAKGNCRFGDKCKYSHEQQPQQQQQQPNQQQGGFGSSPPFGNSTTFGNAAAASPLPFGNASGPGSAASPSPFGNAPAPSPFNTTATTNPSPFGSSSGPSPFNTAAATNPSPFTASSSPAPAFGAPSPFTSPAPAPAFGSSAPSASPFGAPSPSPFGAPSSSPFGTTQAQTPAPFGSPAASFGQQQQASPFGGAAPPAPTSAFGGTSFASPSPAPFGSAQTQASPFGAPQQQQQQVSPFGAPQPAPSSAFGGTAFASPSPLPFGGTQTQATSAFGAPASTFGSQQATPFGQQTSPFSAPQPAPAAFGGTAFASPSPGPFGGTQSQAPAAFGSPAAAFGSPPAPSPFGQQQGSSFGQQASPFSAPQPQQSPFGAPASQDNRPLCKFFAQGNCKFGNQCRFSHQQPAGSTFGASPFGGPRR